MIKKTIMSLVLFLALLSGLQSQKVNIKWGELSKSEFKFEDLVIGEDADIIKYCYQPEGGLLSKYREIPILTRYNSQGVEKKGRTFQMDDKSTKFEALLSVKNNLYLYSKLYDKGSKTTSFYCQKIDMQSLNDIGGRISLGTFAAKNENNQSEISYHVSNDSSKILMVGLSPEIKNEDRQCYVSVFDNSMNKLWDNTITLTNNIAVISSHVTKEGKAVLVVKEYDKGTSRESIMEDGEKTPSYKVKICVFSQGDKMPNEFITELKSKFVSSASIVENHEDNIVVFGLYKERVSGYITGFFINEINKTTKENKNKMMSTFPAELLDQVKKDKQASNKGNNPGLYASFTLTNTIVREDKSIDYILEYQKSIFRQGTNSYNSATDKWEWKYRPYWEYTNSDIIDISLKPDGKIIIARVPKIQLESARESEIDKLVFSRFKVLPYKNKLVFFYNDDRDNENKDLGKCPDETKNFNRSVLMMAVVDAKGNVSRQAVADNKGMNFVIGMNYCRMLNDKRIALYGFKRGGIFSRVKDVIGMLEID